MDISSLAARASTVMSGKRNDDGLADRLNYRYTVGILVVFAIINMNRMYVDQIKCWVPAYFTPNYEEYVRSVCFVQNTYYIKPTEKVPKSLEVKRQNEILYYQWIPFLLLVKAFLFYLPRISWRFRMGIQIADLIESAFDYKLPTTNAVHRKMCLDYMVDTIDEYVDDHRRQKHSHDNINMFTRFFSTICCTTGRYLGNYLVVLYITTKLMYIFISLFQIFILSIMLKYMELF
ncbi:unnamed protein product [Didymodactylos carnosus]|uniref:Innexin n=1 Tax=Didymodactylos carnosus TaxID=1234261 RepID=A0A8S2EY46_9BILA|nr:unnamed protein product [Didymodactylos carnosus]CAF4155117.1 unnamed protein product [Didymodactylos carnosus]